MSDTIELRIWLEDKGQKQYEKLVKRFKRRKQKKEQLEEKLKRG